MAGLSYPIEMADAGRRQFWRISAKTLLGRLCIEDRATRLAVIAVSSMCASLALTVVAPMWLFLIAPILLGVPHIVGDVRYLLVRPPAPVTRMFVVVLALPLAAQTVLRVVMLAGGPHWRDAEVWLGVGAVAAGVLLAPGAWWRRLLVAAVVSPVAAWALMRPALAGLTLAHLHNFIALAFWLFLAWRAMPAMRSAGVGLFFLGACALLMLGFFDAATAACFGFAEPVKFFEIGSWSAVLAPGLPDKLALRLVQVYIFAQSVHYLVWLRLVPQQLNEVRTPTTFAQDVGTLKRDFGRVGLALIVALTLAVPIWGLFDAYRANTMYLSMVLFHGWMELACLAYFAVSGLKPLR